MALPLDRMTGTGLGIAALGWVALAGDAALGLLPASELPVLSALARSDIFTVAEATVVSGFAVALLGTLRAGFGALHGFFDAVLARAAARPQPDAAQPDGAPEPADTSEDRRIEPLIEVSPPARHTAGSSRTSRTKGRNYSILPNGAVEVDTLLGTRVFASLAEAKDYIR